MCEQITQRVLDVEACDGVAVVQFATNTLNAGNSEPVGNELSGLPIGPPCRTLSLDFGGIQFVSATALGMLVTFNRAVRDAGCKLSIDNAPPFVYDVFETAKLTQVFDVRRSR